MKTIKTNLKIFCHDCQKEIKINSENELLNGLELIYDNDGEKIRIFKCKDCFKKDQSLRNYQACEVYSRVVGYLRPVQQWNEGKVQEFKERKEYKVKSRDVK